MIKSVCLLLLFAALSGGVHLYFYGNGMLVAQVEKLASDAIGVKVHIGSIHVALADKKVTVKTIEIANPPGFEGADVVKADSITITLKSAGGSVVDFQEILVKGSVVNLELNEHGLNVLALKDLANRKEQKEKAASQPIKVIIEHMMIDASTIHPSITRLPGKDTAITMPSVTLSGIGEGKNTTAGDAMVQILNQYLSLVAKQASNVGILKHLPNGDDINNSLKGTSKSLKNLF